MIAVVCAMVFPLPLLLLQVVGHRGEVLLSTATLGPLGPAGVLLLVQLGVVHLDLVPTVVPGHGDEILVCSVWVGW